MIFTKIFKTSLIRGMTRGWIVLFILFSCRFFARNHRRTSGIASRVRWGEILVWINYILDSQISYLLIQALGLIFFKTFRRSSSIRKKSKPTVNYLLSSKELSYLSSEIYKLVSSKPSEFYGNSYRVSPQSGHSVSSWTNHLSTLQFLSHRCWIDEPCKPKFRVVFFNRKISSLAKIENPFVFPIIISPCVVFSIGQLQESLFNFPVLSLWPNVRARLEDAISKNRLINLDHRYCCEILKYHSLIGFLKIFKIF